jgi:hypothetical protein
MNDWRDAGRLANEVVFRAVPRRETPLRMRRSCGHVLSEERHHNRACEKRSRTFRICAGDVSATRPCDRRSVGSDHRVGLDCARVADQ